MTAVIEGTLEGFLTLVYDTFYKKLQIKQITTQKPNTLFDDSIVCIQTDIQKANKVYEGIQKSFSKKGLKRVLHCFLSKDTLFLEPLYSYVVLGFKDSKNVEDINITPVKKVHEIEKKLFRSLHKAYGFTRFVELDDKTLYAKVSLEFQILPLLAKHFQKRLGVYDFMIHDVDDKMLVMYKDKKIELLNVSTYDVAKLSKEEQKFSRLWKVFFQSVSIESRKNEKLQQNMLPLIYRKYMTEFL